MRYIEKDVATDLRKKMVWIAGPRQCGKTHLAKKILNSFFSSGEYLNWDRDQDRLKILKEDWRPSAELLVFDEIHKYKKWKSLVKGYYDSFHKQHRFLITGSAQLDTFKKGGDSLLGRYHYWRLHPFTLSENVEKLTKKESFERLMKFGGFPEPFLDANEIESNRWRQERYDKIIKNDIRDIENIREIDAMRLLLDLLRSRVGGPIVVSNLAADLQKSPTTIAKWIDLFERMYLIFTVKPFTKNVSRSVQKPYKVFFYDNQDVIGDEGARFENLVANHLLKRIHYLNDRFGRRISLNYIRDKEKREVDFALVENNRVTQLIEAKLGDEKPSAALMHFSERLKPISSHQIVMKLKRSYQTNSLRVEQPLESALLLSFNES